jgi:hypothetical protein
MPEDNSTPIIFEGFENTFVQLPIAQAVPCAAAATANAFARGAVGVALPMRQNALPNATLPRAPLCLPDGGQLRGH